MKRKKVSKKIKLKRSLLLLLLALVLTSSISVMYSKNLMNTNKIYDNVYINGIEVSGLDKNSAKKLIEEKFKYGNLTLKNGDEIFTQDLNKLGFSYNVDDAVAKAYTIGRKGTFIQKSLKILGMKIGARENIKLVASENLAKLDSFYKDVESKLDVPYKNATISVDGDRVSIVPSRIGHKVDVETLKKDVEIALKDSKDKNPTVEIKIIETQPNITEEQLKSINGLISTYTSSYDSGNVERAYNVSLAAQKVDNKIVMPGEEVSFLDMLGYVNEENGFKISTVIVNNKYEDGVGGGVCQVSSTLYNALLMSGVGITQRTNHTFPIGYIPIGRDATVANDGPDLKYKNNYDFPIFIRTYANDGTMVALVYGDVAKAKKYEVTSEVTSTTQPKVVYENDSTMPKGKEEIKDFGHTGYTASSYKITSSGEKILIANDTYSMTPKIIKVGTGKPIEDIEDKKEGDADTQKAINNEQTAKPTPVVTTSQPVKNSKESQDNSIF